MKIFEYCLISKSGQYDKYGYLVSKGNKIDFVDNKLSDVLNELGKDGWEMVGCSNLEKEIIVYFKREIQVLE